MKVTVAQIAKAAGVSPGTVSNALNNRKGSLSEEKRQHIIDIAEKLGYFKKGKRTGVLRLVIYSRKERIVGDTPFFSELIRGFETAASANGYQLNISYIDSQQKDEIHKLDDISVCDGLLLLGTEMNLEDVIQFENFKIPYVIVDNAYIRQKCDFVAINNRDGIYEITTYLIDKGHEKIGLINSINQINNFKERKLGFMQALMDNNIQFIPEYESFVSPTIEESYADFKNYLQELIEQKEDIPSAFVAVNDNIALGALRAISELHLQISITGFDDIPFSSMSNPSLTTVQVDKMYLGKTAVHRLVEKLSSDETTTLKILVETKVVERNSVTKYN
ncbi:LacI family DNA-binding transcriptional regulator [Candidatus Stoquefichus massiliensis]|uniref:LacI family DNA-binding transcriptional regulator n=1 Tax=Candidatus Stoquefichus massiliensis TaxID=1470350 RepID=UPI00048839B1|nr:LacI family DNA-binding transcriptional regulator [Candidatus Stoquefichus massiliensis]